MLRFLSDENFNGNLLRSLFLRIPSVDVVRVQDTDLSGTDDATILAWAGENDRIVLTHDRRTFPRYANRRVIAGDAMPGVFVVDAHMPLGQAIEELLLIDSASEQAEWRGLVVFLPL